MLANANVPNLIFFLTHFPALCYHVFPYKPDVIPRVSTWRIFPPKCGMLTSPALARLRHHPVHIWYALLSVYSVPIVSNTIQQRLEN